MTPTEARQWTLKEIIEFCDRRMKNCETVDTSMVDAYCQDCCNTSHLPDCKCPCHIMLDVVPYSEASDIRKQCKKLLDATT